jgi:alpha-glucosidase (family GH31 glycosyl hydrolase)
MWHAWKRRANFTRFWWESQKERDHLKEQDIDGIRMDLTEIDWGSLEWIELNQNGCRWRAVVNTVTNLRVLASQR